MTTIFTIPPPGPYRVGQRIVVYGQTWVSPADYVGTVLRVEEHELLMRVGGRAMAFVERDGRGSGWTWRG